MSAKIIETGILLTFDEIRILLYSMGVVRIEGVYMPEKNFSEKEIISAMHHMAAAGFIEAGEERFLLREDIRRLLEIMAAPARTDIWRPRGEGGPAFFLYWKGEQVVVSEQFFRKKETLRLSIFDQAALEKWMEEFKDDYRGD